MHMLRRFILVLFLICPLMIGGCSQGETETDLLANNDESLIYEETISPNEDYVSSQDDIVYYTIRFYQDEDDKITVTADSNALLFEKMEYEVPADVRISKENIEITWTTMMGNPDASKEDQLAIAQVKISIDEEVLDERKINFASNAFDIITKIAGQEDQN